MDDVETLQLAPLPEVPPHHLLQLLGRLVRALQQVAHEQSAAGLHKGAHARHVVLVLAVAGAPEDVEQLVALAVVLGQRDAVVENAVCTLRTHAMCKVNTKEAPAFVGCVALVGFGVSSVLLQHTAVGGRLPISLLIHVTHVPAVPQVILIVAFCVVLLGIDEILLFASRPGEELGIQV